MKKCTTAFAVVLTLSVCTSLASAELCDKCKGKSYTKDIGSCTNCQAPTSSGQFKLCKGCSAKLNQCEHCLATLAQAPDKTQMQDGLDAAKIAFEELKLLDDIAYKGLPNEGNYKKGKWELNIQINDKGTRSQGWTTKISYDGKELPEPANLNDWVITPWGKFYWYGPSKRQFGGHNWHISPNAPAKNKDGKLISWPNHIAELRAATIAKKLETEDFYLMLQYQRQQDKDKYLSLTITTSTAPPAPKPNWLWAIVSREQAAAIVECLKACGFLAAAEGGPQKDALVEDPGYQMVLSAGKDATLWLNMPIDQMLVAVIGQIGKAGGEKAQEATSQVAEKLKDLVKAEKKEESK